MNHEYWKFFAGEARRLGAPLYEHLAIRIGNDPEIRAMAATARPGQPHANLILAAVHYLLLAGEPHALKSFYPSVGGQYDGTRDPYPAFREFCLLHRERITRLVSTRVTNTNEVARCTALYPAFDHIAQAMGTGLHMVEIGPSAGFNLNWDRYGYVYRRGGTEVLRRGNPNANLVLECELRGELAPEPSRVFPEVVSRLGLELNPVDLASAEDRLWLRALVFTEAVPRLARLDRALSAVMAHPVPLRFGDALETLAPAVDALPAGGIPVIFHSFVTYQFSTAMRTRLEETLSTLSRKRPVVHVSMEWENGEHPVTADFHDAGAHTRTILADCSPHGVWLEWRQAAGVTAP